MVLSEKTSRIGRPDIVLTEKRDPERLSATEKREPETPTTSNLADGTFVPTPTLPLPVTEKMAVPAEF
jgi:hypothetical protein